MMLAIQGATAIAMVPITWFRYRAHRKKALALALDLVGMENRRFADLLMERSRGTGEPALNSGFRHGETPELAALSLVGFVVPKVIEEDMTPQQRNLAQRQLYELDVEGQVSTGETMPLINIIMTARDVSGQWVREGRLEKLWQDYLVGELYGAVAGIGGHERMRRRIEAVRQRS